MLRMNENPVYCRVNRMKITRKITLLYGTIFSLSLLLISSILIFNVSLIQQYAVRSELSQALEATKSFLLQKEGFSRSDVENLIQNSYADTCIYNVDSGEVYTSLGEESELFDSSSGLEIFHKIDQIERDGFFSRTQGNLTEDLAVLARRNPTGGATELILEDDQKRQLMLLVDYVGTDTGNCYVAAFRLLDLSSVLIRGFMSKVLLLDLIGIFASFIAGAYISARMLRPVEQIREAAERITVEDLSQRIETDGPDDEMKELKVTFNSMIDRLEQSFERQNQFVSDASHELRTPISVIQGYANLINRWGKSDPEILQESIDSILSETEHMSELIRRLLLLAKSDQNRIAVQKEPLSLNETAREILKEVELLESSQKIMVEETQEVYILGNPDYMKQLLWIYVENAQKYSDADAQITIRVWADEDFSYISVKDTGKGIAKEDLPHIFDRFYRADKSRNKEISGTGLGLSIAAWIVETHDGEILVESTKGEGTMFTNRFRRLEVEETKQI